MAKRKTSVTCPRCGARVRFTGTDADFGQLWDCPECGQSVRYEVPEDVLEARRAEEEQERLRRQAEADRRAAEREAARELAEPGTRQTCRMCWNALPDGAPQCPHCGAKVGSDLGQGEPRTAAPFRAKQPEDQADEDGLGQPPHPKKRPVPRSGILGYHIEDLLRVCTTRALFPSIVLLCLLGVAGFMAMRESDTLLPGLATIIAAAAGFVFVGLLWSLPMTVAEMTTLLREIRDGQQTGP